MERLMMATGSGTSAPALRALDERSDEELMAAYAADEPGAFELLLPRFADRLWGYFAKTFRDRAVADDLYQTTILKLHGARKSFRAGAPFRPWLFGIASRARADELRRHYRRAQDSAYGAAVIPEPNDPDSHQRDGVVRDAITALPESQREVVMLHCYAGLSFQEIGELLAEKEGAVVAAGTVRARAFRAYATLRDTLADWAPADWAQKRAMAAQKSETPAGGLQT